MQEKWLKELELIYNFKCVEAPTKMIGGSTHDVYKVQTNSGCFVVKILNDTLYHDSEYMERLREASRLELILKKNKIPIINSICIGERSIQVIAEKGICVFPYYDGKIIDKDAISVFHCKTIGKILADIHRIDVPSAAPYHDNGLLDISWENLLYKLYVEDIELYDTLSRSLSVIIESQERGNIARERNRNRLTICHNDLGKKNVLWKEKEFRIIDLEGLALSNPLDEIYSVALAWSWFEGSFLREESFINVIKSYSNIGGRFIGDPEDLYYRNNKRLRWLAFNINRYIDETGSLEKKKEYKAHISFTVNNINNYYKMKEQLLLIMNKL